MGQITPDARMYDSQDTKPADSARLARVQERAGPYQMIS